MTKLLVSVRSRQEACLAVEAGVDLIDVKEPNAGSLGRATAAVWHEIAELANQAPLSAALGELRDWEDGIAAELPPSFSFAKLGLAGMAHEAWQPRWQRALARLPSGVQRVAVVYADHVAAQAPPAGDVLSAARDADCRAVLVDTFVKDSRGLFAWWSLDEVSAFVNGAQQRGMLAVVAGSLKRDDVPRVQSIGADYLAVRGAVCETDRAAALHGPRLLELMQVMCAQR